MGSLVLSRSVIVLGILLAGSFGGVLRAAALGEPPANVKFIPEIVEVHRVNETFTVALVIEGAYNLSGINIIISWNDTYLTYVNHTLTFPIEDFPDPIPPSPYPGILHAPKLELVNTVVDNTYQAAIANIGGPSFNSSGTVFVITFKVLEQPPPDGEDAIASLNLVWIDLARSTLAWGGSLPYNATDGVVIIHPLRTHELTILSRNETAPLAGVLFTINGKLRATPYSEVLPEDSYTFALPEAYGGYNWSHWLEDGSSYRIKTIMLDSDATWTGIYELAEDLPPHGPPIGGTTFSIESEGFSSWFASTLLIASFVVSSGFYIKWKKLT